MNRSRTLLLVLSAVAVTLLVGLGLPWMLAGPEGEGGGKVLTPADLAEGRAHLPRPDDLAEQRTPEPLDAPENLPPPADAADGPEDYPRRDVAGRVVIADGGPIPPGLQLSASWRRPATQITEMLAEMSGRSVPEWIPLPPGAPPSDRFTELTLADVHPDGTFVMRNVPIAGAFVQVHHAYLYAEPTVRLEGPGETGEAQVLVRLERGGRIRGVVTDPEGAPLEDVALTVASTFDPWLMFDTDARTIQASGVATDEQGRFDVQQIPAGSRLVLLATDEKQRWQARQMDVAPLAPGEERATDIALAPGATISGVVVGLDGAPVGKARVGLQRLDLSLTGMNMASAKMLLDAERSDEQGRFAFPGLSDGAYKVGLREDGYRRAKSKRLEVEGGDVVADVELLAEPGLTLSGRVRDRESRPVVHARVWASRPLSMMDWTANLDRDHEPSTHTDEEGRFELAGFDPGALDLRVTHDGFVSAKLTVDAGRRDIDVSLSPTAGLSGVVVSLGDGEPVRDFTVSLMPEEGLFNLADPFGMEDRVRNAKPPQTFKDREDGTFEITDVVPGGYDVVVTGGGFAAMTLPGIGIGPEGHKGLVVMLPPEGAITGVVIDGLTGAPVPGASVSTARGGVLETITESLSGSGSRASTDTEGRFRLGGLGTTPISPSVRHDAYREQAIPALTLAAGEVRDIGLVRLSKGGTIWGNVRDALGRGEAGVMVMVSDTMAKTLKRATTDAAGGYRVEGLGPGSYNVMRMDFTMNVGGDGGPMDFMKDMVFNSVTIEADEEKRVDLDRKTGAGTLIHGVVRSLDGPAQGAMLTLMPARGGTQGIAFASTNEGGRYEMTVDEPGDYVLTVIMMGEGMAAGSQPTSPVVKKITVGGLPEQRQDVMLPGGVLLGVVESAADGKRLSSVRVLLERTDEERVDAGYLGLMGGRVGEAYTDEQGAFSFRFVPGGTYSVVAGGHNMLDMGAAGWAVSRVEDVAVSEGSTGFTLHVKVRPAGEVSGTVTDTSGQPLTGVGVWALDSHGVWQSTFSEINTDLGGAYLVDSLEAGLWTLAFRDTSHALKLVSGVKVRLGDVTTLDVTLGPGIALELVLAGHDPGDLDVALVGPEGPLPIDLFSMFELLGLGDLTAVQSLGTFAPGLYHLTVTEDGTLLLDTDITLSLGTGGKAQIQLPP